MDRSVFTYYSTLLWGSAPHKCQIIVEFLVYKEEKLFLLIAFSSLQFSHSVVSDSLWPHESQHTRFPCPSPTPRVYANSCPSSRWCHPTTSSCYPLLPPSIFPSIRVSSNESVLHIRWPKYRSFSFSISLSNEYSGLISFRMDWLDLLAVQGTLKSLLQHHSSKASVLQRSAFFIVQLSHPYMTTGKNIALTRRTFVGKVMSLLKRHYKKQKKVGLKLNIQKTKIMASGPIASW